MPADSQTEKYNDFRTQIPELPDEEIVYILKRRHYYLEEAKKMAIDEAVKRGIINSEQDLFSDEYNVKPVKFSLFPKIEDAENRIKITKSIARVLIISGVLPAVWGIIRLNFGALTEGIVLIVFGATWIFYSAKVMLRFKKTQVWILIVLLLFSSLYFIKIVLLRKGIFVFMDFFIPAVLYLLIVYGLIFLYKINR